MSLARANFIVTLGLTLVAGAFAYDGMEQGCTFRSDPDRFLRAQSRAVESVQHKLERISKTAARYAAASDPANAIVKRNFIDDEIFGKLEQMKVNPAPMSSDEEFIRRVYLDIIGRIPSAADVKNFVSSAATDKRERLVENLLVAPEFNDKWSVWFEDLIGMTDSPATQRRPQIEGRISFDRWIREQLQNNRPMTEIVRTTLTATGNNFYTENGPASFMILGSATMGPAQDTFDLQLVKSVTPYLGLGHYDCLLCHSGRGHLDQLSVWATRTTRADAERLAAHFARTRLNAVPNTPQYTPLYQSTDVQDIATGTYDLNTTFGNRPNRVPIGTERSLTPEYRDGTKASGNWRAAFANKLTSDPMFGVNFANRVWKEFFGMGLIDPVDAIDPDRLDPSNPPPAPWTLQPTHPELLQKLAKSFMENDSNLRHLIKTITLSSAYQLSSRYDDEWKVDYVPLFARHYPRRLWAEEIHDAIVKSTGVLPRLTWQMISGNAAPQGTPAASLPQSDPVSWAMQLPDITEPRGNGALTFMSAFFRGNRDSARRSESGSILQQLFIMNDSTVVISRIKMAASPVLKELAKITDNGGLVDELWLSFLSRKPSADERAKAVAFLGKATTAAARNTAIEDLAWVAINKVDFVFSY